MKLPALEGLAEGLVVVGDAAVGGGGPAAEHAEQRGLAAAGRAHHRQHLAGARRPRYPAQYLPRRPLHRHPVLHLRKLEVYGQGGLCHEALAARGAGGLEVDVVVAEGRELGGGHHVLGRRGEAGEGEGEAEAGAGGAAERGAAADEVLHVQLQLRAPGLADVAAPVAVPAGAAAARRGALPEAGLARQAGHVGRAEHRLRRRRPAERLRRGRRRRRRRQLVRLAPPDRPAVAVHHRALHDRVHRPANLDRRLVLY